MAGPGGAEFRSVWTEVHGLPVHAKVSTPAPQADRPPLVLVHGLALSHAYMMPTAERLGGEFRVHVPDLPGFGESAHPEKTLDVPGLADALAAWMGAIGVPRAALLGNSFACQIIVDLAARHPQRVLRTVLQGPTTPPEERSWLRQFVRWRQNNRYNPPELGPISWRDYRRAGYLRALQSFRLALKDRIEDKLPRVAAPSLVVRGQYDPICRAAWAAEVARLLPRGQLVEIPGAAHTLVYTAPEQLAAVARRFLSENGNCR
jgi:2-hydroxy-6-oxonona-2,4-dienedioate hydrolase